jgi:GMP synthase (glutamine-hydrolysing)
MRILSVLHPGGGHSGVLRECAAAAGHELLEWRPGAEEPAPLAPADADALAVFGGGMNVADAPALPWLGDEIALLRAALEARTPVLGICLGAQLLAAAAGAGVTRARAPEIGWHPVALTPAAAGDPVLGALPARFTAYGWHSFTFAVPAGAVELARSPVCPQAYRLGEAAWGVQFHPEVTPDILAEWIGDWRSDPDAVRLGFDPDAARAAVDAHLAGWNAVGRTLFDGWLAAAAARLRAPA